MKKIVLIAMIFLSARCAFAQYNEIKARGDKAFKAKDYYDAAFYYKQLVDNKYTYVGKVPFYSRGKIDKKELRADYPYVCYQLGECYRLFYNYTEAQKWYNKLLIGNYILDYPLARFWYANCLRADRNFDESIIQLHLFITNYKGDKKFRVLADQEILNCQFAKQQYQLHPATPVTRMQKQLNADAGDYALTKYGGNFWFTSSRFKTKNGDHINFIYNAVANDNANPVKVNFADDGNKDVQYSAPSLTSSAKRMYVTRWYTDGAKTVIAIYFTQFENGKWAKLEKLSALINQEGYHALQPFVTADGKRLFFVSDKPGGQGGYDIWVSDLDNTGIPLNATNLGKPSIQPKMNRRLFTTPKLNGWCLALKDLPGWRL